MFVIPWNGARDGDADWSVREGLASMHEALGSIHKNKRKENKAVGQL
jgi:hypothetical protein